MSSLAAIKKIENRIAVLSKDPTKNEQVISEYESLREYLLLHLNEEDEEDEDYVDLQLLEKKRVVEVIMDLLSFGSEHHQSSSFTPDLLDKLGDVGDPMLLLLNGNDLGFIHKSVEKLYDCSDYYDDAILDFCQEAKEWLQRHTDDDVPSGDDDRITVLKGHFTRIISARDEKVKLNRIKQSEESSVRALALAQSYNNNNNRDTNINSYEDGSESDKDSDSDEEKQEKIPILERDRKDEFYDGHGRQSNRKRLKTSDEEQQEKSFVPMSSKFEHDGAMLGCYDAGLIREDVRAK